MSTALNNIIYGGEKKQVITKNCKSAGEFILNSLRESGDRVILVDALNGNEITAKVFRESIVKFARCLQELGVKQGDVIGICSENRLEFAYTIFATVLLNAIIAPINVTYTEREIHHALNLSKPKVMFSSGLSIQKISNVTRKNTFIKHLISFDDTFKSNSVMPYKKFLGNANVANITTEFETKPVKISEHVMTILCSSGTTGLPKGVQLTQRNILSIIDGEIDRKIALQNSIMLTVVPWFHTYGCLTLMIFTLLGVKLIFLPKFQEHQFLNCIQYYKVDTCFMVPPLMVFLAKHSMVDNYDLSSLKNLFCGAAPLSKETEDAIRKRIGVTLIRQRYGLTEATLTVIAQTDGHDKPGSVGIVKLGIYAKVIDENGKALGPNQPGELCVKGEIIMKGYLGDEKATNEAIDSDGWLHTGDIAYYDEDFDFFIVDRLKELIKYKGFQVPPAEIEGLLLTHPKIRDAAVVGLADEACGELPVAFVAKDGDVSLSEKEVIAYISERVSPAKRLHGGVRFIDEIPKNPSGKIVRRILRDSLKTKSKL